MATAARFRPSNPGFKRPSASADIVDVELDPLAPLRSVPHQSTFPLEDLVQTVVWQVGRAFGFQAFNVNPLSRSFKKQQHVPSTIFLAGDHLVSLLVKNIFLREKGAETEEERWAKAVWTLHGTIFANYEDKWCPRVRLPARLHEVDQIAVGTYSDPVLLHGMLCELSLYFLMYTECANLRHVPEFMWFLFWAANTSPSMQCLWLASSPAAHVNGRARRVAMRNAFQNDIASIQKQLQHDPAEPNMTPDDCFKVLARIKGKVPHPAYESIMAVTSCDLPTMEPRTSRPIVPEEFGPADVQMYEDLIALGDGGFWCDRVLTPVFYVLSYEMDARVTAGTEITFRLGYDDINECASNAANISDALHYLGVDQSWAAGGAVNTAHEAIVNLGFDREADREQPATAAAFDPQLAAVFWASKVFTKTYRERRTWLSIYRAFYRVYALHFLMIHILMAHAFSGNDLKVISSAVVTHAFLHFFERLSNYFMSRNQADPLNPKKRAAGSKLKSKAQDPEEANTSNPSSSDTLAEAAKARSMEGAVLEGDPVLGFFGCFEWGLIALGLLVLYVAQFIKAVPPSIALMSQSYWLPAAGGYTALMLMHGLVTTRDGYSISLTSALRLPRLFTSSSARPRAQVWLDGNLRIGARQFFLLVAFWGQTILCKGAFDYFVIFKPLVPQIKLILKRNWLSCAHDEYNIMGSRLGLPCIDGDWVLVVVRVLPFILVTLMDTHIFYQITLVIWGVIRGICVLDIGVVGNWEALTNEFHQGPLRWWDKVLSKHGNIARLSLVAMKRAQAAATSTAGYQSDHGYESDSGTDPGFYSGASDDGGDRDVAGMARERLSRLAASKTGQAKSKSRYPWRKANKAHLKPPSDMALILQGQSDEHVAMWDAFAAAWDEIVTDLREADMVNNREQENLRFIRLSYDRGLEVSGVRPILMPAFFFAGQIQKAVDTGITTAQQSLVLGEGRTLLVWLGAHLGLLPPSLVAALLKCSWVPEVMDLAHQQSRQRCLHSCIKLLGAIAECAATRAESTQEQRRRLGLASQVEQALTEVLSCLQLECQAVLLVAGSSSHPKGPGSIKNKFGLDAEQVLDAESLLSQLVAMTEQLDPKGISASLRRLNEHADDKPGINAYWGSSPADTEGSTTSAARGMSAACNAHMVLKVVNVVLKMMTLTPAAAKPASEDAQRVLSFFMSSLANKQLTKPKPLDEMLSWTVLTPCYEEDVLYPLEASSAAKSLGCAAPAPRGARASLAAAAVAASKGASHALTDLCSESEDRVSLMAFLRSVFPHDWENFKERLGERLGVDLSTVTEDSFVPGAPLADMALELQLWASYRGQLLARTVRGMMCYDRALRVLARLENPCPPGMPRTTYDAWIKDLVASKFSYVVSAQVYGRNRASKDVRSRWLAEGVDVLLEVFAQLKVAFLDTATTSSCSHQYSVLIQGRKAAPAAWEAADFVSVQRVEELYRVRLPQNRYSPRGVIIGEGKPENQNHAIIFCQGEGLQTIDMNQDNHVAEAYKMRNLLDELEPEIINAKGAAAPSYLGPHATGTELRAAMAKQRESVKPTALVGFCEHIFSDKSGALGSFAASAEFAFGTIVQRTMDTPGNVRMHYGHPDVFNKLHIMTRGGVSKATRQLHISEDIFGGYSHTLRGARIRYREYMSVGKGRDMGFDSINAFEIKISGGAGEVAISRDLWRLSTRMDFFRLLHFYHSGIGYYLNTWLVMHTVFAQIFTLCFFAMARAGSVGVEQLAPADPTRPQDAPKYVISMQDTLKAEYVLQLGTLSLMPYLAELALEHGVFKCLAVAIQQLVAGSWAFFVFKQQTTSYFFFDDMAYGGAMYIGTGRGFSITTSHFLKLWTNYSRSHIMPGVELMSMCFLLLAINDCPTCSYGALTWGVWLVSASLVFAPFWFNPMIFSATKVKRDFLIWSAWLRGEVDPDSNTSWHSWHRKQMEKPRNDRGNQTSHHFNIMLNVITSCSPLFLLALAAVSRLDVSVRNAPGPLQSSYILFLVATAIIWAVLALTMSVYQHIRTRATQRRWRLYGFWTAITCLTCVIVYLAVLSRFYSGNGFNNLLLIMYANVNLLLVAHRAVANIATKSPRARALVDSGYLLMDMLVGYSLLCVLYLLSCTGIVAWLQATLLFNPTFAKSIRRGQLVRTIGMDKADPASQQPEIASIEAAVSNLRATSPAPQAVPRSRGASMVATRMQITASRVHVDDSVY